MPTRCYLLRARPFRRNRHAEKWTRHTPIHAGPVLPGRRQKQYLADLTFFHREILCVSGELPSARERTHTPTPYTRGRPASHPYAPAHRRGAAHCSDGARLSVGAQCARAAPSIRLSRHTTQSR